MVKGCNTELERYSSAALASAVPERAVPVPAGAVRHRPLHTWTYVTLLSLQDLRAELERICGGSLFRHATGTSNSFKVSRTLTLTLTLILTLTQP